jgi:hypothetical protein
LSLGGGKDKWIDVLCMCMKECGPSKRYSEGRSIGVLRGSDDAVCMADGASPLEHTKSRKYDDLIVSEGMMRVSDMMISGCMR